MEHMTASIAHFVLSNPEHFDPLPPSLRELFFWHAIEEIEHKSVAFDVYAACVGDPKLLRHSLFLELVMFPYIVARLQRMMLRERNHRVTLAELAGMAEFMIGPRGLLRTVVPKYLAMLKPGFHPWDLDDSALVESWKLRLSSVVG